MLSIWFNKTITLIIILVVSVCACMHCVLGIVCVHAPNWRACLCALWVHIRECVRRRVSAQVCKCLSVSPHRTMNALKITGLLSLPPGCYHKKWTVWSNAFNFVITLLIEGLPYCSFKGFLGDQILAGYNFAAALPPRVIFSFILLWRFWLIIEFLIDTFVQTWIRSRETFFLRHICITTMMARDPDPMMEGQVSYIITSTSQLVTTISTLIINHHYS